MRSVVLTRAVSQVDPATGASVWERPAPYAWTAEDSADHPGRTFFFNTARPAAKRRGAGTANPPPPATQATKESTWERPAIMGWKARGCGVAAARLV